MILLFSLYIAVFSKISTVNIDDVVIRQVWHCADWGSVWPEICSSPFLLWLCAQGGSHPSRMTLSGSMWTSFQLGFANGRLWWEFGEQEEGSSQGWYLWQLFPLFFGASSYRKPAVVPVSSGWSQALDSCSITSSFCPSSLGVAVTSCCG